MATEPANLLYYGDLDILRERITTESVASSTSTRRSARTACCNVFFAPRHRDEEQAQIETFDDTWTWRGRTRPPGEAAG